MNCMLLYLLRWKGITERDHDTIEDTHTSVHKEEDHATEHNNTFHKLGLSCLTSSVASFHNRQITKEVKI